MYFSTIRSCAPVFLAFFLILNPSYIFADSSKEKDDNRTPFEKYQGAYTGAWLMCVLNQKLAFTILKLHAKGLPVEADLEEKVNIPACKKKGLAQMKQEYINISPLVKNKAGEDALLEHYVAAIMHVKETHVFPKETESSYTERMNETQRNTKELWVRFEITQP